jgi:hypothetical protein
LEPSGSAVQQQQPLDQQVGLAYYSTISIFWNPTVRASVSSDRMRCNEGWVQKSHCYVTTKTLIFCFWKDDV